MTTSLPSSNCWANNKLLKKDNAVKLEINEKYIEPLLKFNPNNPKIKFMPLSPLYYDKHLVSSEQLSILVQLSNLSYFYLLCSS